ncbi:MAG TPA: glycoside hydrolase family 16 protein, partial [Polyangia bacterium]
LMAILACGPTGSSDRSRLIDPGRAGGAGGQTDGGPPATGQGGTSGAGGVGGGGGGPQGGAGGQPGGGGGTNRGGSGGSVSGRGGAGGATNQAGSGGGTDAANPVDLPPDVMMAAGCPGVLGHSTQPCADVPTYPGVKLALVEDFDDPIDLDKDPIWTYSDGFSDSAQVRYVKSAISFGNGRARISLDKPSAAFPLPPTFAEATAMQYPAPSPAPITKTSGELRTKYNNFKYGYYEFRMKPPTNRQGNFIASGFVLRTPRWQDWRSITVELQAAAKLMIVPTNVIVADNQTMWTTEISDALDVPVGFDTQAEFHDYGFEWQPDGVKFYVDRATNPNPIRTYAPGAKLPIPNKAGKIMMNFWTFPNSLLGGGDMEKNVYPMVLEIEHVRFYKSDREPLYPCANPPACLPDEDRDYSKNNVTDGIPTTPSGK